jgi:hypothetical protein
MAPLRAEIDQLNRQFWVTKAQVKANKYDLSASRYRQVEQDEKVLRIAPGHHGAVAEAGARHGDGGVRIRETNGITIWLRRW